MRYLFSVAQEQVTETEKDRWAAAGEPVVPWFPAPPDHVFISIGSFKRAIYAVVEEHQDLDLEVLSLALLTYYPGLTRELLDNYVLATAKAAYVFPIGTKLQITVTPDTAKVYPVGKIENYHTLWTEQPYRELKDAD